MCIYNIVFVVSLRSIINLNLSCLFLINQTVAATMSYIVRALDISVVALVPLGTKEKMGAWEHTAARITGSA